MKTIGLLGGMSWESTLLYYRLVNEGVRDRLGGLHSARCLLYSVDFHDIEELQVRGEWDRAGALLAEAAVRLQAGGADCIVLCTNTMHRVAPAIEAAVGLPLIHIADPTAEAVREAGVRRIGLLGTRFTMEQDFYRGRLEHHHGLEVLVPGPEARERVHQVIYEELCLGVQRPASKARYVEIAHELVAQGAEGVILGCTEIGMLLGQADLDVPLFDTTTLHARAAVRFALGDPPA